MRSAIAREQGERLPSYRQSLNAPFRIACAVVLFPIVFPVILPVILLSIGFASPITPVRALFFDQPIGGMSGEFGARKPGACGYEEGLPGPNGEPSFSVLHRMLEDTLSYSKVLHKKLPVKGPVDCNSANIGKWFDPRYASGLACKDLPFTTLDMGGDSPRLSLRDTLFFPIDSLAPPDQLEGSLADFEKDPDLGPGYAGAQDVTFPKGYSGRHNFNWCMEINAQFLYKGGETFSFRGDDDVWIYLDDKLVVDIGGIHGEAGPPHPLQVDTLPFITGRIGETFDFDLYFCERRPGGSSFTMNTSLDIRPVKFQDLEIVDANALPLDPSRPISGKQRVCALPFYAESFCGNTAARPPGRFLPAIWSLNGAVIAKDSCIVLDPDAMPSNTRIALTAKAEGKTSKLNLHVLKANVARSIALKGNGRLESVEVALDSGSDSLEAPVRLEFPFAGARRADSAFSGSFDSDRRTLSLALTGTRKGPVGHSGLDTGTGLFTQTLAGHPIQQRLPLEDSITPVLRGAQWSPVRGVLRLDLSTSEPMAAPFPGAIPLLFKNRQGRSWRVELSGAMLPPGSIQSDAFRVSAASLPFSPRDADSISFSEAARDLHGNASRPYYLPLVSEGWALDKGMIPSVRLEANPIRDDRASPVRPSVSLVVIDKQGNSYSGSEDHAKLAEAAGAVLAIRSIERLDRLEIRVYSNLGARVDAGVHAFSDAEWEMMLAESGTDTASARVMWIPSSHGSKLGTGAYIIKGSISTKRSYAQDASGRWQEKSPVRKSFGPLLFGYLRR